MSVPDKRPAHVCAGCGATLNNGARFCAACGAPVEGQQAPADERKLATVLFADLAGSTQHADARDPERTRALLDRFYDAMAAEVERAGGTVEKFVGDAVMAAFGVPVAHEDDAERALHCAVSMQRRMTGVFGEGLALRIGVNTGEVVAGRSRGRSSFVSGDTVNVAKRLEAAACGGEILVGERAAAAARGAFEFGEAGRSRRRERQTVSAAAGCCEDGVADAVARQFAGSATPFVGRGSELDAAAGDLRARRRAEASHISSRWSATAGSEDQART